MVYNKSYYKRRYKKRFYKKKRSYRRWKRHYYRRYIRKAPEIHRSKIDYYINNTTGDIVNGGKTFVKNGSIIQLTTFTKNEYNQLLLNGVPVDGRKVNLKYIYIKGYKELWNGLNRTEVNGPENNFYGRMAVYCQRNNTINASLSLNQLYPSGLFNLDNSTWYEKDVRDILFKADYKDDTFKSIRKYHKRFYAKYDDLNNIIPIKKRIVLNKVIECDEEPQASGNIERIPSRNALWLNDITRLGEYTDISDNSNVVLTHLTVSLYWTDY